MSETPGAGDIPMFWRSERRGEPVEELGNEGQRQEDGGDGHHSQTAARRYAGCRDVEKGRGDCAARVDDAARLLGPIFLRAPFQPCTCLFQKVRMLSA